MSLVSLALACTAAPIVTPKVGTDPQEGSANAPAIVFIEDDYPRALAAAKAQKKPLVIDAWAIWCHSCISMRAYVFSDPALRPIGERFVWLALDTEKPQNAAALAQLPIEVMPTLFVLDPTNETKITRWLGAATVAELTILLEDAAATMNGGVNSGDATATLLHAESLAASGKWEEAKAAYRSALEQAPVEWPRRARAVLGLVQTLADTHDEAACVSTAIASLPDIAPGTARVETAITALLCGLALPPKAKEREELPAIADIVARMAKDPALPILADDRSGLYEVLVDYYGEIGDKTTATSVARTWSAFLDERAAAATTPEARSVFDAHRLLAYLALGEPAKAIPMLEASERDFPSDYGPPARLARAYVALKKYDDALAAIDRALAKVYGPRQLRVLAQKADIYYAVGKRKEARATLKEAIKIGEGMQLSASYTALLEDLRVKASKP